MNETGKSDYARRIEKVCAYIYAHLDEDLGIEQLAAIANFSPFHFHRQFTAYTGIPVFRFCQLLRLKRASYQLVFNKNYRVIDIALDAKFENPESFSRAFKKAFGQTPSDFRKAPKWQPWAEKYRFKLPSIEVPMDIEMIDFAETKVAVLEHRGPSELLNDSVAVFIQWRKQSGLSPVNTSRTFGLIYDDPETTEPARFRFDICGEVQAEVPANPQGVITKTIPAGRCAHFRHHGSYDALDDKVRDLYGRWLPESGEELRDFPCYLQYVNLFPEVAEHALVTDVYLPVK